MPSESVAAFAPHTEHQGHVLSCLREQTGQDFCLCRHSEVSLSDPKSTEIEFPLFCRGGE